MHADLAKHEVIAFDALDGNMSRIHPTPRETKMALPPLINSLSDAKAGICQFQKEMSDPGMINLLSSFQSWYAIPDGTNVLLAPSKFIGYVGMTAKTYLLNNKLANGRDTEVVLARFFALPGAASQNFLMQELSKLLNQFGKKPNKRARVATINGITLMSGESLDDANDEISPLDAIMTFYRMLSADDQREFRRRITR